MKLRTLPPDVIRARVLQLLLDGKTWTKSRIDRGLTERAFAGLVMVTVPLKFKIKQFKEDGPDALDDALETLVLSGWVFCPQEDKYRITDDGREMAKAHPDSIPDKLLPFGPMPKIKIDLGRVTKPRVMKRSKRLRVDIQSDDGFDAGGLAGLGSGSGGGGAGIGPGAFTLPPGPGEGGVAYQGLVKPVVTLPGGGLLPPDPRVRTVIVSNTLVTNAAPAVPPPPDEGLSDELITNPKIVPVWYGTNRKPKNKLHERDGYGDESDDKMHYGYCEVNVPEGYVRGGSGKGFWKRLLSGEPTKLKMGLLSPLREAKFWSELAATLKKQVDTDAMLLFVHGYRVSFEDATVSAGQLSHELQIPTAFFSWTSRASFLGYDADEDEVDDAVEYLKAFLTELAAKTATAGKKLHIIAHSMGNRAVLRALHEIALAAKPGQPVSPQIAQVIFAAPDMPRRKFIKLLAEVVKPAGLTAGRTLYAANDKALWGSGVLHVNKRAGFLPPVTTAPELVTVDVSKYNLSWLGHSYVFRLQAVIADINTILGGGKFLKRTQPPGEKHWVLG